MEKKGIHISQCMIVKNEEKNMERALSWGKDVMWEQIVVDTGSTDCTVELAGRMGAKVFSFPWIDDFAAAKNYALEQAQGEWIAFLDADEYMTPEDIQKLNVFLNGEDADRFDGISMGVLQLEEDGRLFLSGNQTRFFRNTPDIRYRRRIHEQLESLTGKTLRIGDGRGEFSVIHTGYQKRILDEKKSSGRNRWLIQKELEEHPNDYEMLGYMGDECFADGDRKEAEKWYRRAVSQMPVVLRENDQRSAVTYTNLLLILTEGEAPSGEDIDRFYQSAVKHLPEEADFDYILGRYLTAAGKMEEAVHHLEKSLKKLETFGSFNKAVRLTANLLDAYELLVRCCYGTGETEKCITYAVVCLQADRYQMVVLSRLLMLLASDMVWEAGGKTGRKQIMDFLEEVYDFTSLKDRLFIIRTAEKTGCSRFAGYVKDCLLSPEERALLGKV